MGQAKNRGTFEQRKAEAIEAGRVKADQEQPGTAPFLPGWIQAALDRVTGRDKAFEKPSDFLQPQLVANLQPDTGAASIYPADVLPYSTSSASPPPLHVLSEGAERNNFEGDYAPSVIDVVARVPPTSQGETE